MLQPARAVLNPRAIAGNPFTRLHSNEHSPARFRRPRTRAGVEDRRFPAADEALVRAGQCRHRARGRMRRARCRRPCRGDRVLQDATRSISSWSARRRRWRRASSTTSRTPASRRSGRAKRRRSSRAPRVSPRSSAREFNIPTGAYGRFTDGGRCAGLCARAGRADRGQGRRARRRQGRRRRQDAWRRPRPPSP